MKRMLLCLTCMLLVCAGAVAQNRQGGRNGGRQQGNGGRQFQPMAVIDTAVINHIGLSEELLTKVYELQTKQAEVAKEQMAGMMPERGKRMSEEDRKAMIEKSTKMKATFRLELRELIGVENYIIYLEKQLDTRNMFGGRQMQMGGQNGGQRGNWGGGAPGGFGGPGGGQGSFGGGDFPGGGF